MSPPRTGRATVADRVRSCLADLRPAERRVAQALLSDYPRAGLGPASSLATAAGVSPPTVVRFAASAGFAGYSALQHALRDEVSARLAPDAGNPWSHAWREPGLRGAAPRTGESTVRRRRAEVIAADALQSVCSLTGESWEAAVAALADERRPLRVLGGRYTATLAHQLVIALEMLRSGVSEVTDPLGAGVGSLLDLARKDVLVAFDIARYQESTVRACEVARRSRAQVILVTDLELSPAVAHADIVLPVSTTSPSLFPSLTGASLLLDQVILAVTEALGDRAIRRMRRWEAYRRHELAPLP